MVPLHSVEYIPPSELPTGVRLHKYCLCARHIHWPFTASEDPFEPNREVLVRFYDALPSSFPFTPFLLYWSVHAATSKYGHCVLWLHHVLISLGAPMNCHVWSAFVLAEKVDEVPYRFSYQKSRPLDGLTSIACFQPARRRIVTPFAGMEVLWSPLGGIAVAKIICLFRKAVRTLWHCGSIFLMYSDELYCTWRRQWQILA